jgi:hypothetical protein
MIFRSSYLWHYNIIKEKIYLQFPTKHTCLLYALFAAIELPVIDGIAFFLVQLFVFVHDVPKKQLLRLHNG